MDSYLGTIVAPSRLKTVADYLTLTAHKEPLRVFTIWGRGVNFVTLDRFFADICVISEESEPIMNQHTFSRFPKSERAIASFRSP